MRDLLLEADLSDEELLQVQEEPALEIALPQVFTKPSLTNLRRGKLPHVEWVVARLSRTAAESNGNGLGPDYQTLVNEFQPLFTWGMACWDFLLSTEGCRFVPRTAHEQMGCRGDYRVVTDADYSRLLHRVFRQCVLEFTHTSLTHSLSGWLRLHFWEAVLGAYRSLEQPPDPRQRTLTAYSYLRCVPYQFLNDYHHELVLRTLQALPLEERRPIEGYFLRFLTLEATAHTLQRSVEDVEALLRRALLALLLEHRLVYCLLRQIERY